MWRKVMWYWRVKILLLTIFLAGNAAGQVGQTYFSADPVNLYEWRSSMVNPSIGVYQNGALEMGFKLLHLGFADNNAARFKATYLVVNLPRLLPERFALGIHSQLFTTPIFQETSIQLNLARPFLNRFSLGISLGFRGLSYDRSQFDLVDPNDPVFSGGTSRWQPDIGIGATLFASAPVLIGIGINHLNRPAVSLNSNDFRLEPTVTIGVAFRLGGISVLSSSRRTNNETLPGGSLQWVDDAVGMLQMGYGERALWLRSRLRVKGNLSIGYGFSYPIGGLSGTSLGSHEAILVYEFNRIRKLPSLDIPEPDWEPYLPETPRVYLAPQFYPLSATERVTIYEKRLHREIQGNLSPEALARLSDLEIGSLDSSFVAELFPDSILQVVDEDSLLPKDSLLYSPGYRQSLNRLQRDLQQNPVEVTLITPATQKGRAVALKRYLKQALKDSGNITILQPVDQNGSLAPENRPPLSLADILRSERMVLFRPGKIRFRVYSLKADSLTPWSLVVEDARGKTVWEYEGNSTKKVIDWDWRKNNGQIIEPGFYRYYIRWFDDGGREFHSLAHTIYARKFTRDIHIRISPRYESPGTEIDKIGIILNK